MHPLSSTNHLAFQMTAVDDLINSARMGVSEAFDELVRRYQSRVYRTALKIVFHPEDAQDVSQEVFVSVLKNMHQYRHDAAFSTWITRIAINMCLMHLRKKRRNHSVSLDEFDLADVPFLDSLVSSEPSPEQTPLAKEHRQRLHDGLSRLPATLRDVTQDRLQLEAPIVEIASRRGITVSAAKSRLLRARGLLVAELKNTRPKRIAVLA